MQPEREMRVKTSAETEKCVQVYKRESHRESVRERACSMPRNQTEVHKRILEREREKCA